MPPALAFSRRHSADSSLMRRFFADLERLAFSLMLQRKGVTSRIERFSAVTAAITAGRALFADDSPLQLTSGEIDATRKSLDGPIYEDLGAKARALVLLRVDALLTEQEAVYDHAKLTVEHVLPQTPAPGSEWTKRFPDASFRRACVDRLGNLALLSRKKNSAASNFDFDKKKTAYFTKNGVSSFALTTQVLACSKWTPEAFNTRQLDLHGRLCEHWRL